MKSIAVVVTAIAALFSIPLASTAFAHDYKVGGLQSGHPWARATPNGASVGGGYLKITNTGTTPDRLVSGTSAVSGRFEVHEMSMDNGVMKMRLLKDGIEIKPGETVELKPGGFHIMMLDLKEPIKEGARVKGTLVFEKAGSVDIEYAIVPVGGSPGGKDAAPAAHSGHQH